MGSRSVAPLNLNLCTNWTLWSASRSDLFTPGEKPLVPIELRVITFFREEKNLKIVPEGIAVIFVQVAEWTFPSFCVDGVWGNTWSRVILGNRKNKEELAVRGSGFEGRKGESVWLDVWKIAGDAAGEACLPVWLVRRRPDPQDSLSETDEASGGRGRPFWPISAGPAVWIYKSRGGPNPRRSNDKLALHIRWVEHRNKEA